MPTFNLVNDSKVLTDDEQIIVTDSVQNFANRLQAPSEELGWTVEPITVVSSKVTDPTARNIYLDDKKINHKAYGFHNFDEGKPTGYVSPTVNRLIAKFLGRHNQNIYGVVKEHPEITHFSPVIMENGVVKVPAHTTIIRAAAPTDYTQGFVGVICHELAEMVADPHPSVDFGKWATIPANFSGKFPNGGTVLIEIGDHTRGHFSAVIDSIIKGVKVSTVVCFPDVTLPSFYDPNGKAPYSYCNLPKKPFDFLKGAYAFIRDPKGARMMNFAEAGDERR
jgi:hypothetical protein